MQVGAWPRFRRSRARTTKEQLVSECDAVWRPSHPWRSRRRALRRRSFGASTSHERSPAAPSGASGPTTIMNGLDGPRRAQARRPEGPMEKSWQEAHSGRHLFMLRMMVVDPAVERGDSSLASAAIVLLICWSSRFSPWGGSRQLVALPFGGIALRDARLLRVPGGSWIAIGVLGPALRRRQALARRQGRRAGRLGREPEPVARGAQ